jgi:hypothetical protein
MDFVGWLAGLVVIGVSRDGELDIISRTLSLTFCVSLSLSRDLFPRS